MDPRHGLRLGLQQTARMEQRLIQSPQMIQAMQILQLPTLDLQERIEQELMENPFLELIEGEKDSDSAEGKAEAEPTGLDRMLDELESYERDFGDGTRGRAGSEDGDRKLEAMQNTPEAPRTLAEGLIEQLAILDFSEADRAQTEYQIFSLDERGYLLETLEDIARQCELPEVTAEDVERVLAELRRVSHAAIGASDLRDCLLLQLDALEVEAPLVRTLIEEHLEDITTNRLPRIAKATGHSIEEVKQAIDTIRTLEPYPGSEYGDARAMVITPDVMVEEVDGAFEVRLNRTCVPELTLSPLYRKLLREARKDDGVREWVRKRVEGARWFIDAVLQRQSTMERIARSIFVRQRPFLERGIKALEPLRMQEIADQVGVHISTVSRAVSGKYAQTPRGTFPLKFFFTGGTQTQSGGVASQVTIKQHIVELVQAEDGAAPLSDDQIAALLQKKHNVKIARRTVTKYRKALAIPSSSQRREF